MGLGEMAQDKCQSGKECLRLVEDDAAAPRVGRCWRAAAGLACHGVSCNLE
jgi:hypothetical protein